MVESLRLWDNNSGNSERASSRDKEGPFMMDPPVRRFNFSQKIFKSHFKLLSELTGSAFE